MGLASTFVLLCSNISISLLKNLIPDKVRIPCFIVIIASFVTIVELLLKAYLPALDESLGIFIPLIVVNCMILGRAEGFASKNKLTISILDALGMGIGFSLALLVLGSIRELFGFGTIFGFSMLGDMPNILVMIMPPGAFLTLAFMLAFVKFIEQKKGAKS
jgi:Na+-translocating ferredoxin:NAD+ oxidoreductase subunit E